MERLTMNNVEQCWNCQNQIGEKAKPCIVEGKEKTILLPECKVEDKYMTYVFDNPCDCFKQR